MNGVENQVLEGYINIQSGHVAIVWEDLMKISNMDPGRFMINIASFDPKKDDFNKKALERLKIYIREHKDEIKAFYSTIRRNAQLFTEKKSDFIMVYSLTTANRDFLLNSGTLFVEEGDFSFNQNGAICISREKADDNNLEIGDLITIEATTPYGAKNSLEFIVKGIYANRAGYENIYGFISEKNARELFDFDPEYFDIGSIYLKNKDNAAEFAKKLDKYLTSETHVLRAESFAEASAFYTNTSRNIKLFFNVFIIFMLCIIAIGLRSTIRMNLFERMREFGTIRAIGYSRFQSLSIIFAEIFFLSLISLMFAFFVSAILVLIFGRIGIYVGPGPISYALGGESFYPHMKGMDLFFAFAGITILSLISSLNPGIKICYQKISDLLIKHQRKISLTFVIKSIFSKT